MRKFSVVIQQVLVIFAVLVLPSILLFMSYANSIADSSTRERENAVQSSLQYVNQTFGLLADTAHSEAVRISASEDYITAVTDFQYYDQVIQNIDLKTVSSPLLIVWQPSNLLTKGCATFIYIPWTQTM